MRYLLIILLMIVSILSFSSSINSNGTGGGVWSSSSTWNPEIVPGCYDTINILAGDSIYITSTVDLTSCSSVYIEISGTVSFQTGKKLILSSGSIVNIKVGGKLVPGSGGGNSNYLEIGGNTVWNADDGTMSGPLTYDENGPLPIKLLIFNANINDTKVDIRWITESEINNDYFTIERSKDCKKWKELLTTKGSGNSNQLIEYFEIDYKPLKNISYYRLKQTNFNGNFSYSGIIPIKYENVDMNLFPNPVKSGEFVTLTIDDIGEILVVLMNISGVEYYSKIILSEEDNVLFAIPINSNIPKGIYLVIATSENLIYSHKLIIK